MPGVAVDPMLLARLDAKLGDTVMIGDSRFKLRAILRSEPDKLAGGVGFGPRVMMTRAALAGAGLVTPGSIVRHVTRVTLRGGADADVKAFAADAATAFPQAGWEVAHARRRLAAVLAQSRPLHAIADARRAHRACRRRRRRRERRAGLRRTQARAIRRAQGARRRGSRVFAIALAAGAGGGGLRHPARARRRRGDSLGRGAGAARSSPNSPYRPSLDAHGALFGALYGLLVALIFALVPLGRAHEVPVAALLRDDPRGATARHATAPRASAAAIALAALVMATSFDVKLGATYVGAAVAAFALLRGAAWVAMRLARGLAASARRAAAARARQHLAAEKPDPGADRSPSA